MNSPKSIITRRLSELNGNMSTDEAFALDGVLKNESVGQLAARLIELHKDFIYAAENGDEIAPADLIDWIERRLIAGNKPIVLPSQRELIQAIRGYLYEDIFLCRECDKWLELGSFDCGPLDEPTDCEDCRWRLMPEIPGNYDDDQLTSIRCEMSAYRAATQGE
jgi:hypothetical protein